MPATNNQIEPTRFWVISGIGHALVLFLLIWLFPAKEFIFEDDKPKAKITKKDKELAEIVELIRDVQAEKLRQRVALLGGGTDRMHVNLLNVQGRHKGFAHAQKSAAFTRIRNQIEKARQMIKQRQQTHNGYKNTVTSADDRHGIPIKNIQIRTVLDDIAAAVPLLPEGEAQQSLTKMVNSALGMHNEATRHVHWMMGSGKSLSGPYVGIEDVRDKVYATEKIGDQLTIIKAGSEASKQRQTQNKKDYDDKKKEIAAKKQEWKKKISEAQKKQRKDKKNPELKKAVDVLRAQSKQYDVSSAEELKAIDAKGKEEKKVGAALGRFRLYVQTADFIQRSLNALQWSENVLDEKYDEKAFAEELKGQADDAVSFKIVTQSPDPSAPWSDLQDLDIVGLFEKSDELIVKLTLHYRAIKAIQLAELRDMAFESALSQIQKIDPLPTQVDKELLRQSIEDPDLVEDHKKEVERVKLSVEEKIELAERLLMEIEQWIIQGEHAEAEHEAKTLEDILAEQIYDEMNNVKEVEGGAEDAQKQQQEYAERREAESAELEKLVELAREDERQKHKDLAEQMKEVIDIKDLTEEEQEGEEAGQMNFQQAKQGAHPLAKGAMLSPNSPAVLARKISKNGEPVDWMFVDTWYTIGPFPNEMRKNINTKFPPETIVDLDASYTGKNGKTVKWEFIQSRESEVTPARAEEYAIYYAFTEIYCDEACDVWIAVGSDDKANVWINDLPVWISGDQLKGWNIGEGYRKVHLKKGYNKVLYRIENGWLGVAFSMSLYTTKP